MYQAHQWWFPDQDTHFVQMLDKNIAKGKQPVYQEPVRRASINYCQQNNQTQVALDIGANVGLWTRDLCQYFNQVHAVEPVQIFRDCLVKNVTAPNLKIYDCALGATNTQINMIITPGNTGHTHVDADSIGKGQISMRTLDSMNFPPADYVKLDCEGYELQIIKGGENYIRQCHPIIVVEQKFHQDTGTVDRGETVDLLKLWGARLLHKVNNDLIMGW